MIEAIIFDCFGVLVTDGWLPFKRKHFGDEDGKMNRATELNHMVDAGLMPYGDFVHEIAEMAGVTDQEVDRTLKSVVPNEELLDLITNDLKSKYKIGMLSNVADDWLKTMFTGKQLELFDTIALSFETGVIKPDPRSYEIVCDRLEVEPTRALFIDDLEHNVVAAKNLGMQGIIYRKHTQFLDELHEIIS